MNRYFTYEGFGLLIFSEIELPELRPAYTNGDREDVLIRMGSVPRIQCPTTLYEETAIRNPNAAFLIRNGREITVEPCEDADPAEIRAPLLGRVMAFLFRQRGWLPLHASGVVVNGQCILLLGATGAGKSTTAAAFHRSGHEVITDDIAPVRIAAGEQCFVQSAWSYVRLCADAKPVLGGDKHDAGFQAGKYRYDLASNFAPGNLYPVRCAYVLDYGETFAMEQIEPLRTIPLLSRYSFARHRTMSREALQSHLICCSSVANCIPVRRLIRPRSLHLLPTLVSFVEEDLAALRPDRT